MPPLAAAKAVDGIVGGELPGFGGAKKEKPKPKLDRARTDGTALTGAGSASGVERRQLPRDYRYRPQGGAGGERRRVVEGKVKYKVGILTVSAALTIALIIDGLQFLLTFLEEIPGVMLIPMFLGLVGSGIITFLYAMCGVEYTSGKKALQRFLAIFGTATLELVPLVDDIPTLTADALFTAISSRQEDEEKHEEALKKQHAEVSAERQYRAQQENQRAAQQAANDNQEQEAAEAA